MTDLNLKDGHYYRRRDGRIVGPVEQYGSIRFPWYVKGIGPVTPFGWTESGHMKPSDFVEDLGSIDPSLLAVGIESVGTQQARETIVAAAIQLDGVTFSLPRPARHAQVMHSLHLRIDAEACAQACQGFLTSEGRFVNRVMAKHIAYRAGQPIIRNDPHPMEAFSEDFW